MSTVPAVVRVDGSETMGMGHVVRCVHLLRELSRSIDARPVFVMKELVPGPLWIRDQRFEVQTLPADSPPGHEIEFVAGLVAELAPAFVLTDLRILTRGLIERVRAGGVLGVTIDEWGECQVSADILTNGTVVPAWHRYELAGEVHCYVGGRYALLDPRFAVVRERGRPADQSGRVFVALGGDDPFDLTPKAMRALELVRQPLVITVVIGPGFGNQEAIRRQAADSRHAYEIHENTSEMAELMDRADVGITGGGLTALEMACVGTPALILCEVEHQVKTAEVLEAAGAAQNLGLGERAGEANLAAAVSALFEDAAARKRMSTAGRELIDGRGCQRVAEAIVAALVARAHW